MPSPDPRGGHEAAGFSQCSEWRGSRVAARGARAADRAGHWISQRPLGRGGGPAARTVSQVAGKRRASRWAETSPSNTAIHKAAKINSPDWHLNWCGGGWLCSWRPTGFGPSPSRPPPRPFHRVRPSATIRSSLASWRASTGRQQRHRHLSVYHPIGSQAPGLFRALLPSLA